MDKNAQPQYFLIHKISRFNKVHREWKQNQKIIPIIINKIKNKYLTLVYAIKVIFKKKLRKYIPEINYTKLNNI